MLTVERVEGTEQCKEEGEAPGAPRGGRTEVFARGAAQVRGAAAVGRHGGIRGAPRSLGSGHRPFVGRRPRPTTTQMSPGTRGPGHRPRSRGEAACHAGRGRVGASVQGPGRHPHSMTGGAGRGTARGTAGRRRGRRGTAWTSMPSGSGKPRRNPAGGGGGPSRAPGPFLRSGTRLSRGGLATGPGHRGRPPVSSEARHLFRSKR